MKPYQIDLHVHLLQSLYAEDLYDLAKDVYQDINWNRFGYLDRYKKHYNKTLDPIQVFREIEIIGSLDPLREVSTYQHNEHNSFEEFDIISFFTICITGYYFDKDEPEVVLEKIVQRYKQLPMKYIEFRNSFGAGGQIVKDWHARFARYLKEHSDETLTMKYCYRLGSLDECLEMLEENPDIIDTVVAIDFSGREIAPEERIDVLNQYNLALSKNPNLPVLTMHIGEAFDDITLCSAIRRVHQAALFGVKRVSHAIALGIDPQGALNMRKNSYRKETIKERLYQIEYDLKYRDLLLKFGIEIDVKNLTNERRILLEQDPNEEVVKEYNQDDVLELRKRQDMVLSQLNKMGVLIEICPTSNHVIGAFPSYDMHSLHKIYSSGVDITICTDDPGVFDITLEDEYNNLELNYGIDREELSERVTKSQSKYLS